MGVYTLCFSPTGGTKRVLDLLAAGLADVEEIDLSAHTEPGRTGRFGRGTSALSACPPTAAGSPPQRWSGCGR